MNGSEKVIKILNEQVVPLHKAAVKGNEKAVEDLHQLLEQVRADYPGFPLADAYHGSTMILMARDKTKPMDKLRWSKAGLKLLDAAVNADPQDSMIRLLRGKASYMLPDKYFHRAQTAIEDYTFLINHNRDRRGILKAEEFLQIVYELGEVYARIGRNRVAAMCWKRLMSMTKDPNFLHLLKLKLKTVEGKPAVEQLPDTESPLSILKDRAMTHAGIVFLNWSEQQENGDTPQKRRRKKKRH